MENDIRNLSRKERERLFKRQEIVDAARTVFAVRGFNAATLDEIADHAEFSKGTLYNYFQSKDELFESVIADVIDEFIDIATETCMNHESDLRESYTAFAQRLMRHLFANFGIYGLVMREFHKTAMNTHLVALLPNLIMILAEPLNRAIAQGEILPLQTSQTAMVFLSTVFSLFKTTLHMKHADALSSRDPQISLASEKVEDDIREALCIIERTFFFGLYQKEGIRADGGCF